MDLAASADHVVEAYRQVPRALAVERVIVDRSGNGDHLAGQPGRQFDARGGGPAKRADQGRGETKPRKQREARMGQCDDGCQRRGNEEPRQQRAH